MTEGDDRPDLTESEPVVASKRRRWPWSVDVDEEIDALSVSIELYPDNPTHYVLRGEYFEAQRQMHLAAADFEKALQLAAQQVESARWGLISQVIQDRAMMGLRRVTNSE